MAKHKTISQWQFLVEQFLRSKQTMESFCAEKNVNLRTFENKYYQLRSAKTSSRSNAVTNNKQAFVQVTLPSNEMIKIKLPNGISLELAYKNLSAVIRELFNVI